MSCLTFGRLQEKVATRKSGKKKTMEVVMNSYSANTDNCDSLDNQHGLETSFYWVLWRTADEGHRSDMHPVVTQTDV